MSCAAEQQQQQQELKEENRYLQLKLRYMQSVGTIFRQKMALLLESSASSLPHPSPSSDATRRGGGGVDGGIQSAVQDLLRDMDRAENNDDGGALSASVASPDVTAVRSDVSPAQQRKSASLQQQQQQYYHSPQNDAAASDFGNNNTKADYWREQFLTLLQQPKSSNIQEAHTLCKMLQEKNDLSVQHATVTRKYTHLKDQHGSLEAAYRHLLESKAIGADDCLKESFKAKEQQYLATINLLKESNPGAAQDELRAAQEEISSLKTAHRNAEQQSKVLRLRQAELRKQLQQQQTQQQQQLEGNGAEGGGKDGETTTTSSSIQNDEIQTVCKRVFQLQSELTTRDAQVRRLEAELLHMEKNVSLRDRSIFRLQGRVTALKQEVECALTESLSSVETKETVFLKRQVDTYELQIRSLEKQSEEQSKQVEGCKKQLDEKDDELARLNLKLETAMNQVYSMTTHLGRFEAETTQRDTHGVSLGDLQAKLVEAIDGIDARINVKRVTEQLSAMETTVAAVEASERHLKHREKEIEELRAATEVYKNFITHTIETQTFPTVEAVEAAMVKTRLMAGSSNLKVNPKSVVVATSGLWKEMRSLTTGATFYLTTDVTHTPFTSTESSAVDEKHTQTEEEDEEVEKSQPAAAAVTVSMNLQTDPVSVFSPDELCVLETEFLSSKTKGSEVTSPEQFLDGSKDGEQDTDIVMEEEEEEEETEPGDSPRPLSNKGIDVDAL